MGNQQGGHSGKGAVVIEEALESMQKEKQRDEHLKNLEFKRSKSIRRSIAKRLKGGRKRRDKKSPDQIDAPTSSGTSEIGGDSLAQIRNSSDIISTQPTASATAVATPPTTAKNTATQATVSANVTTKNAERDDKKTTQSSSASSSSTPKQKIEKLYRNDELGKRKPLVGEPQPLPTHVQV